MLPSWLAVPVEQNAITWAEAHLILSAWKRDPNGADLDPVEKAAVVKLYYWTALALMDAEGALPQ